MCYETDYLFFAEQKREEARTKQKQRAGVIHQLLDNANKPSEGTKPEQAPVQEVVPAK